MSEWDRLEALDAQEVAGMDDRPFAPLEAYGDNVVGISDDIEIRPPSEAIALIDPSAWTGTEPPERRWKVKDYIPDGQATLLTGKGAAGKSLVSQLQCTCIAMGLPFLGLEVEQTNALYITCEDDAAELHRRQEAINAQLGITMDDLSGKLFLLSLQGEMDNELARFTPDGRMSIATRYEHILSACQAAAISFLVLDNTAHLFTGNENDRHQVASFINLVNRLAIAIGGAVVIVGHPNKAGDSYSGSTAWENQVRSRLFMEIPSNENGEFTDPDLRVLRREKVNYAQRGGELQFRWFKGTFVLADDLPVAADLGQIAADACDNSLFLTCLRTRIKQRRAVSEQKASRTYAPKEFAEMAESKGIGRPRLERAFDRLFRIGAIERGFLWTYKGEGKNCFGLRVVEEKITAEIVAPTTADDPSKTPMTSSDDLPMTYPMTSPMTSDDLSDDPDDTHPLDTTYLGRGPLEAHSLPEVEERDADLGDPPAWMDEAPPIDPDTPPPELGNWHDNPILNGKK